MTVNSSTDTTVAELAERLAADDVDLVLVSPERLANPEFAAADHADRSAHGPGWS